MLAKAAKQTLNGKRESGPKALFARRRAPKTWIFQRELHTRRLMSASVRTIDLATPKFGLLCSLDVAVLVYFNSKSVHLKNISYHLKSSELAS